MADYVSTAVVTQSVNFGPTVGVVNFTVNEGEDFSAKMRAFAQQYVSSVTIHMLLVLCTPSCIHQFRCLYL